jgi:hypothetical protein
MRAEELGSALKVESAIEKAKRTQSLELLRAEREILLRDQGRTAVERERNVLRQELDKKIEDIQSHLTTMKLQHGADDHEYVIRTERVALNFYLYVTSPVTESRIVVQEFDGPLISPKDRANRMYLPGEGPRPISKSEFYFDYDAVYGWCWRERGVHGNLLTTSNLCEHLIMRLLELHEQFATGKKVRRRAQTLDRHGPWS